MNEIESIFVPCDPFGLPNEVSVSHFSPHNDITVNMARVKMGEIFKIQEKCYAFVCIHCSQEFQYFTEFTLHVEEHYKKTFIKSIIVPQGIQTKADSKSLPQVVVTKTEIGGDTEELKDDNKCNLSIHFEDIDYNDSDSDYFNDKSPFPDSVETDVDECDRKIKTQNLVSATDHDDLRPLIDGKDFKKVKNGFQCFFCDKVIKTKGDFRIHLSTHTQIEKTLRCPFCGKMFNILSYVRKHILQVHKKHFTNQMIREAQNGNVEIHEIVEQNKQNNRISQKKKTFPCPICGKLFSLVRYVRKHALGVHQQRVSADKIVSTVTDEMEGEKIEEISHTLSEVIPQEEHAKYKIELQKNLILIDDSTEALIFSKYTGDYQFKLINGKFECPICKNLFTHNRNTKRHIFTHVKNQIFTCSVCGDKFSQIRTITEHLNQFHVSKLKQMKLNTCDARTYECFICKQQLKGSTWSRAFYNVRMHIANVHNGSKNQVRQFECYLCKKVFRLKDHLKGHMETHTAKPLLCLVCGEFYKNSVSLKHHMEIHNIDPNKQYKCEHCNKTFLIQRYLRIHNRTVHRDNKAKSVMCEYCSKTFRNKSRLKIHMRVHNPEQKNIKCGECGWLFYDRASLKQHSIIHGPREMYQCSVCNKLVSKRYAREHMRIHNGEKKHECTVCGMLFIARDRLRRHMVKHNPELIHKCDLCGKSFARANKLLEHRRTHKIAMDYHCSICNKGFFKMGSLLKHENEHNKVVDDSKTKIFTP